MREYSLCELSKKKKKVFVALVPTRFFVWYWFLHFVNFLALINFQLKKVKTDGVPQD